MYLNVDIQNTEQYILIKSNILFHLLSQIINIFTCYKCQPVINPLNI